MAMAVLTGLTSTDGGMVAAATMSLPERARANRNYDYRYAWIRDQCYAGQAVAAHGHFPLLDSAVSFVSDRLLADGPRAQAGLHGHRRGRPRRAVPPPSGRAIPGGTDKVGNWVNQQFQLDAFGEALELLARPRRHSIVSTPTTGTRSRPPSPPSSSAGASPTPGSGSSTISAGPIPV